MDLNRTKASRARQLHISVSSYLIWFDYGNTSLQKNIGDLIFSDISRTGWQNMINMGNTMLAAVIIACLDTGIFKLL